MSQEFEIPTYKIDTLKEMVEKLNKKASKWDLPPVEMTIGEVFDKEVAFFEEEGCYEPTRIVIKMHKVSIDGMAPKIDGWEFVATVEPTDSGEFNVLLTSPGTHVPEKYRTEGFNDCDHCHK
jgi:hypothetical protein